jgi:uncharacterized protein YndB with AHSA1/START domain
MTDQPTTTRDGERRIETQFDIDAPIESVWKALTDADELMNWFPPFAEVKPGAGGHIRSVWSEQQDWTAGIGAWEPNERLGVIWMEATPPEQVEEAKKSGFYCPFKLAVDYYLEARAGGGTTLRLVHSGFSTDSAWDGQYDGTVRGWAYQLRGLKHYLENHRGTKRVVVEAKKVLEGISLDEAWQRLMGADGLRAERPIENLTVGDRYAFTTSAGDQFEGEIQFLNPPKDLCGTIDNLDHAYVRIAIDHGCITQSQDEVNIFISTYGLPTEQTDALQERCRALLEQLFVTAAAES